MGENRIVHVRNVAEAAAQIQLDFKDSFPIYLRGVLASMTHSFNLSYFDNSKRMDFKIKTLDEVLRDGTELDSSAFSWTRVDEYPKHGNRAFDYARNRGRIDYFARRANIDIDEVKDIKPVILVYDISHLRRPEKVTLDNIYSVRLPENVDDKAKAIVRAYVNNTHKSENWSDLAF